MQEWEVELKNKLTSICKKQYKSYESDPSNIDKQAGTREVENQIWRSEDLRTRGPKIVESKYN